MMNDLFDLYVNDMRISPHIGISPWKIIHLYTRNKGKVSSKQV